MEKEGIEIRWHGRGGQGAITAAKIVAKAMFDSGYTGIAMIPTFGTERRGAPVFTSLKISKGKIYDLSPTTRPDIVVVLDHLLVQEVDVASGLKESGIIIINSPTTPADYCFKDCRIAVSNVTDLSVRAGLPQGVVNSGIIGSFAKATDLVGIDNLVKAIEEEFAGRKPRENGNAAVLCYENTMIGGGQ